MNAHDIKELKEKADLLIDGNLQYFSNRYYNIGTPPNWFLDPITSLPYYNVKNHWSRLYEFSNEIKDIKIKEFILPDIVREGTYNNVFKNEHNDLPKLNNVGQKIGRAHV